MGSMCLERGQPAGAGQLHCSAPSAWLERPLERGHWLSGHVGRRSSRLCPEGLSIRVDPDILKQFVCARLVWSWQGWHFSWLSAHRSPTGVASCFSL